MTLSPLWGWPWLLLPFLSSHVIPVSGRGAARDQKLTSNVTIGGKNRDWTHFFKRVKSSFRLKDQDLKWTSQGDVAVNGKPNSQLYERLDVTTGPLNTIKIFSRASQDLDEGLHSVKYWIRVVDDFLLPVVENSSNTFHQVVFTDFFNMGVEDFNSAIVELLELELADHYRTPSIRRRSGFSQPQTKGVSYKFSYDPWSLAHALDETTVDWLARPFHDDEDRSDRIASYARTAYGVFGDSIFVSDASATTILETLRADLEDDSFFETPTWYIFLHYIVPGVVVAVMQFFENVESASFVLLAGYFTYFALSSLFSDKDSDLHWAFICINLGSLHFVHEFMSRSGRSMIMYPASRFSVAAILFMIWTAVDNLGAIFIAGGLSALIPLMMVLGPALLHYQTGVKKETVRYVDDMRYLLMSGAVMEGIYNVSILSIFVVQAKLVQISSPYTMMSLHFTLSLAEHLSGIHVIGNVRKTTARRAAEMFYCKGRAFCDTTSPGSIKHIGRQLAIVESATVVFYLTSFIVLLYIIGVIAQKGNAYARGHTFKLPLAVGAHIIVYDWNWSESGNRVLVPFLTLVRAGLLLSSVKVFFVFMIAAFSFTFLGVPAKGPRVPERVPVVPKNPERGVMKTTRATLEARAEDEDRIHKAISERKPGERVPESKVTKWDTVLDIDKLQTQRDNVVTISWNSTQGEISGGGIITNSRTIVTTSHVIDAMIDPRKPPPKDSKKKETPSEMYVKFQDGTKMLTKVVAITKNPKHDGLDGIAMVVVEDTLPGVFGFKEVFTANSDTHLYYQRYGADNRKPVWVEDKMFDKEHNVLKVKVNTAPGDSGIPVLTKSGAVRGFHGGSCGEGGWNYAYQLSPKMAKTLEKLASAVNVEYGEQRDPDNEDYFRFDELTWLDEDGEVIDLELHEFFEFEGVVRSNAKSIPSRVERAKLANPFRKLTLDPVG